MQRRDEALVGLVEDGEGLCAVVVGLVEFQAVMDYGVGLEMLFGVTHNFILVVRLGGCRWLGFGRYGCCRRGRILKIWWAERNLA